MRSRRRTFAMVAGAALTVVTAFVLVPAIQAEAVSSAALAACTAPAWAEGNTYTVGQQVTYNGHTYQALVTHTAYVGAGWNPAATPSLWKDLGTCTGGGSPSASPSPSRTTSPSPSTSPSRSPSASPSRSPSSSPTTSPTGGSCAVKARPAGKGLEGYWEN